MPLSVTIDSITHNQNGSIAINYTGSVSGSGQGVSYTTIENAVLATQGPININDETGVFLLFLAWWVARDADLSEEEVVLGKTMTVNLASSAIVSVE